MLLLSRFVIGLCGLRRLRNASQPVHHACCLQNILLLESDSIAAPVTWGLLRSVILVPADFNQLPVESRDAVLCHEHAHIQGHDFFPRCLAEIACALIWFQPLIWIVRRQLREEQELVCDNRVLAAGARPSAYAKLLLDWDVRLGAEPLIAAGMAHGSGLKRRLYALLDPEARRDRVAITEVFTAWFLGLALAFPLAALSFTPVTRPIVGPISAAQPAVPKLPQPVAPIHKSKRVQLAQVLPAPTPLIVSETRLVIVDVMVRDTAGAVREGLTADDFTLLEDGNPQAIKVFEFQKMNDPPQGISSYYVLGYYAGPNSDGKYRRIKIVLKGEPTARVDLRAGYFADNTAGHADQGLATRPPAVIYRIDPEYTDQARKAKYSGTVGLLVDVSETGKVTGASVIRALGMGLDEKAIEAVKQWKFRPATQDGNPIAMQVRVDMVFRLL